MLFKSICFTSRAIADRMRNDLVQQRLKKRAELPEVCPGIPLINLPVYSVLSDVSSSTLKPGANIFPSLLEVVT